LGASGGVSAILLAGILFNPSMKVGFLFLPVALPGFIFGILYLAYSAYMDRQEGGRIAHDAHLYGALYGVIFAIAIYPAVVPRFVEYILSGNYF
jgi:membrane associated rhomboid family serine protease